MTVKPIRWREHDAIAISHLAYELVVTTSVGPRIVSLKYNNGDNFLYEDHTGFGVNEWLLYGGHRFTTAPENDASYFPDNAPCIVQAVEDKVKISAPVRPDRLLLSVEISGAADGFGLTHVIKNCGITAWAGALWAITCIPRVSHVSAACTTDTIHYWPGTDPLNWFVSDDLMYVKDGDFRGKTGWHQPQGWLSAARNGMRLIIYNNDETDARECLDNGSNLEIFACKDWIELETLGKRVKLLPGGLAEHHQQWSLSHK